MNNVIKNVVIFAAGAAIGALVANKVLKDKYETIAQEEIDGIREYYKEKEQEAKAPVEKKGEVSPEKKSTYVKMASLYATQTEQDRAEAEYPEDDEPEEDDIEFPENYAEPKGKLPEPYVISVEDFTDGNPHYDKISINYYHEDDTLADDSEEIVSDVESLIGDDALTCFGDESDDPDLVYVRNERLATDFEVTRLYKSYQETVLGVRND